MTTLLIPYRHPTRSRQGASTTSAAASRYGHHPVLGAVGVSGNFGAALAGSTPWQFPRFVDAGPHRALYTARKRPFTTLFCHAIGSAWQLWLGQAALASTCGEATVSVWSPSSPI